ncbi:L-lactate permease [Citricoccus sp. GCM10030269]|uniref:L-lactate permease n=1 Tax=Citricoccus sp. GCM10030269 TaxID=3273388 RepID=UPI00366E61C5
MAALPIVLTLGLLPTKLPSWVAPGAGLTTALVLAVLWFGTSWSDLGMAFGSGLGTLVEVLAIIAGGILLSRVMGRTGAQQRIASWLTAGGGPTVSSALLMVTGVVPFMESVTGFGVAVIIGLPLLLSLGFAPLRAAVLALLGLAIAPWGSMAPGTLLGAEIAGVPLLDLGLASGVFNLVAFISAGAVAGVVAGRGSREVGWIQGQPTWPLLAQWIGTGLAAGLVQGSLILLANVLLGTAVAGAVGSLVMSAAWAWIISRGRLRPVPWSFLAPYLILLAATVAGQMVERFAWPNAVGAVLGSPALWSAVGALSGVVILQMDRDQRWRLPRETGRMWLSTAVPTGLYLLLGYAVSGGGLAESLATALTSLGGGFLFLVPWIGGLGGYITASNTGANSMFGGIQTEAAHGLGVAPLWVMGSQNAAAGLGCLTSPARVELAYRLAEAHQSEDAAGPGLTRGNILRVTMPLVLACILLWAVGGMLFLPTGG